MKPIYTYYIEDGRFTSEYTSRVLLGDERDIIKFVEDDFTVQAYIICIIDTDVHCVGSIERSFPKTFEEHQSIKNSILANQPKTTFQITFYNEDLTVSDDPVFYEAHTEVEAEKLCKEDYPNKTIYQVSC